MDWKRLNKPLAVFLLGVICSSVFLFVGTSTPAVAKKPQELMWDDMIPQKKVDSALSDFGPGGLAEPEDPWANLDFTQPVTELDGRYVRVPGFVVPLESDEGGMLKEFLLVPYYGACIHTPPPPPNQIIYVTFDEAVNVESIWDPYWIVGTMSTKPYMGDIADTVYRLSGERMEEYVD